MKKSRRFLGLIAVLTMLSAAITGCDLSGSNAGDDTPQASVGGNHGSSDNGTDAPGKDTDAPAGETNAPDDGANDSGNDEHECYVLSWSVTNPTCTEAGRKEGECQICGKIVVQALPPEEHTLELLPAVAPTCSSTGLTEGEQCSVCGTVITEQTVVPADPAAHQPKDIPAKPATCTEAGYANGMECELCGFTTQENVTLPPLGHTEDMIPGTDATCTETGLSYGKYCTVCHDITLQQTVLPALDHIEVERDGILPSCTETGLTPVVYCSRCNDVLVSVQNEIPMTPHVEKLVSGSPASCTESGVTDGLVCRDCKLVMRSQTTIPALGHDFATGLDCAHCDLTLSVGLSYEISDDGTYYVVIGVGSFDGAELVIPAKYEGKPILEIADEAFAGNETIRKVTILNGVEIIGEGAFDGCSALEEVTVPASVTIVKRNAFNDCELLVSIHSASFEQIDAWADDFFGSSDFQVQSTVKDARSPYQVYLEALSSLQRHIDNYTMTSTNKTHLIQQGMEYLALETRLEVRNNQKNFYSHQTEIDHMSGGTSSYTTVTYVNGRLYLTGTGQTPVSVNAGYEYIRAISLGSGINNAVLTEEFFDHAVFYRNLDGTYYLKLVMDSDAMSDLMGDMLEDSLGSGSEGFAISTAEYVYGFSSNGAIASCSTDVVVNLAETMSMRINNDMAFSNIGSTYVNAPGGYAAVNNSPCTNHPANQIVDVPAVEPGCLAQGMTAGQYCNACLHDVTSSTIIPETGHNLTNGACADCGYLAYSSPIAYELSADQRYYTVIGLSSAASGSLTIPESYNGLPVLYIAEGAFAHDASITEVMIPNTILGIGQGAFEGCNHLSKLTVPYVGGSPDENRFLGYVFGADTAEGQGAFIPTSLVSLTISHSSAIADDALVGCTGIKNVTVPTSAIKALKGLPIEVLSVIGGSTIEADAFKNITTLRRVVLGQSIEEIQDGAFEGCVNLIEVSNLSALNLEKGASSNGSVARYAAVISREDVELTYTVNGHVFVNDQGSIYLIRYNGNDGRLVLPEDVNGMPYTVSDGIIDTAALQYVEITGSIYFENPSMFADCASITELKVNANYLSMFDLSGIGRVTLTKGVIAERQFYGSTKLTKVVIGDGVTGIGASAFENCTALTEVTLGNVTYLSRRMFAGCTNLTTVNIPETIEVIPEYAFAGCSKLTGIQIPYSITQIHNNAFESCTSLLAVDLTYVSDVGASAFENCTALTTLDLGDAVIIRANAFRGCTALGAIIIPESVVTIGESAFANCTNVREIFIASGVETIGAHAFDGCSAATSLVIGNGVDHIESYAFANLSQLKTLTIPVGVTSIGAHAFDGCSAVTTLIIENGVTYIGEYAFANLSHLKALTLPASVTTIADNAFFGCAELETVALNNGLRSIGESAFAGCPKIQALELPSTLETIGSSAFRDVSLIQSLVIPAGVTTIGENAFMSTTALTELTVSQPYQLSAFNLATVKKLSIYGTGTINAEALLTATGVEELFVASTITAIEQGAFASMTALQSLTVPFIGGTATDTTTAYLGYFFGASAYSQNGTTVPSGLRYLKVDGATTIRNIALRGCASLTTIVIGNGVTSIASDAFDDCTSLENLTVPFVGTSPSAVQTTKLSDVCKNHTNFKHLTVTGDTAIPNNAFSGMTNLQTIVISGNVTTIGSSAFSGLTKLNQVVLPDTLTNLGTSAFYNCSALVKITLPRGITTIPTSCFYGCKALETVHTESAITEIGTQSFYDCTALRSIPSENTLVSIGNYAFYNCASLCMVNLPDSLRVIGNYAFYSCSGMISIRFGTGLQSIGSNAFRYCSGLIVVYDHSTLGIKLNTSTFGYIPATVLELITDPTINDRIVTTDEGLVFFSDGEIAYLVGYVGTAEAVTLPDDFNGLSYSIRANAFLNNQTVTSVNIPSGVTAIGDNAFKNATNLSTVIGGTGVTTIGTNAFAGTAWLDNATESLYLGTILIKLVGSFTPDSHITIPDGTTEIYAGALQNFGNVASITVPGTVTNIQSGAITGSVASTVYAPAEVIKNLLVNGTRYAVITGGTSLPASAFTSCQYTILGVTLPRSLTTIASNAFQNCYKLVEIWNYSETITLTIGSTGYGYVAQYAQSIYTSPEETSKVQQIGDFVFYLSDTKNLLLGYMGTETDITLPTLDGGKTYEIAPYAFYKSALVNVVMPNTVTSLGVSAFYDSKSLTSVTLSTALTSIPNYAFYGNTLLKTVTLPAGITTIGDYAFYNTGLESTNLPEGLKTIGNNAFYSTALTAIHLPASLESIGDSAFRYCEDLVTVTSDAATLTSIGSQVFDNTAWLSSAGPGYVQLGTVILTYKGTFPANTALVIPDGITYICGEAFKNQTGIISLVIPDSVQGVGSRAFYGCTSLTDITAPAECVTRGAFNNSVNYGLTHIVKLTITSGTTIEDNLFQHSQGTNALETLIIADSVEHIGERAFYTCAKLTEIQLPAHLKSIDSYAFYGCTGVTSLTLPEGLETISQYAFGNWNKITTLEIPASVTLVEANAFAKCTSLTTIVVAGPTTVVQTDTFDDCAAVQDIFVSTEQLICLPGRWDSGWTHKMTVHITSGETVINTQYLAYNQNVGAVIMADTVKHIADSAFTTCKNLKSITFSSNLETIGVYAFSQCKSLESISFPDSLRTIGNGAFSQCTALKSVEFNDGLVTIGMNAFSQCNLITSVTLPDSVVWTERPHETNQAFNQSVTTVVASANALNYFSKYYVVHLTITSGEIAEYQLQNTNALTTLVLGKDVTAIGGYQNLTSKTKVFYCGTEEEFNSIEVVGTPFAYTTVYYEGQWSYVNGIPTPN